MALPHDDLPATTPPPAGGSPGGDANRDPLTQEPGAHPVGVGVGAAGAGAVGALLGSVAGPVGAFVGSVLGAVAGAAVGKEAAETVNPTELSALARADDAGSAGTTPAGEPGATSPPSFSASDFETVVDPGPAFPEPMAEPSPPPGSRLHRIVLAERPAVPPPLEVTAQTAYPEDHVREAAYYRYLERQRTGQPDDELGDWTAAEREVLRG